MKRLMLLTGLVITGIFINAQIIHVPANQPTIQEGINAANNGDTVLVAEGTYLENIFFYGKKITLASLYIMDGNEDHITNTIIDGTNGQGGDWASVVHFNGGEDTTTTLTGFTIQNGGGFEGRMGGAILCVESGARIVSNRIIGSEMNSWQAKGGGIFAASWETGSSYHIIIEDNTIQDSKLYSIEGDGSFGGGIYIERMNAKINRNIIKNNLVSSGEFCVGAGIACYGYDKNHHVHISDNEIFENRCEGTQNIGGGVFVHYCIAHIMHNHIHDNVVQGLNSNSSNAIAGGIGLDNVNEGSKIYSNLVENNSCINEGWYSNGGGMQVYYNDNTPESLYNFIIDKNTFKQNTARYGGAIRVKSSNISITNNYFEGNAAGTEGGAIQFDGVLDNSKTVRIINNTITANSATHNGGGIYLDIDANILLMNNISWNNPASNDLFIEQGSVEIHYCDIDQDAIQGTWSGSDNFLADPLLETDYILSDESPCINAGTESITVFGERYDCPDQDIRNISRPQGGAVDVGAFEKSYVGIADPGKPLISCRVFPNPFRDQTTFEYELLEPALVDLIIYDQTGKIVYKKESGFYDIGKHQVEFRRNDLPRGLYYLKIKAIEMSGKTKSALLIFIKT